MPIFRPRPEEYVVKICQVEVLMGLGMPRMDAIRQIGIGTSLFPLRESWSP